MGSSNPVLFFLKLLNLEAKIANGLAVSVCLGAGQFCKNPGLTVLLKSKAADRFIEQTAKALADSPAGTVVHSSIKNNYEKELAGKLNADGVKLIARSAATTDNPATAVQAALFSAGVETYIENKELSSEVFGPCTFALTADSHNQIIDLINSLMAITATVFAEEEDLEMFSEAICLLEKSRSHHYQSDPDWCRSLCFHVPWRALSGFNRFPVNFSWYCAIHRWRPVCCQNFLKFYCLKN